MEQVIWITGASSGIGEELCYQYNRHKGGCESVCPAGRLHLCEWCLGDHRAVESKKNPQFSPAGGPGMNKGK